MQFPGWLLLLYSLPSSKGAARVGLWRQLKKLGALPFKGSAYLLPQTAELTERFEWFSQQVKDAGGEATLVKVSEIKDVPEEDIIRQFNELRAKDYAALGKNLAALLGKKRTKLDEASAPEVDKMRRQFVELQAMDYFGCPQSHDVEVLLSRAAKMLHGVAGEPPVKILQTSAYQGKTWLTRPRPEVDRVGSAWLIRRFIDLRASFVFGKPVDHPLAIPYDMLNVEFSHHGDDCTFETLLKRFGIKAKALQLMGELIHDADLEDSKFQRIEAFGLDRIFKGWGRTKMTDEEILEHGFQCFEGLYEFLKSRAPSVK